jgi:hypothetical protein
VRVIGVRVDVSVGELFDPVGLYDIIHPAVLMKFDLSICGDMWLISWYSLQNVLDSVGGGIYFINV